MPSTHYGAPTNDDAPGDGYRVGPSPEEQAALRLQVAANAEEIKELRKWRHEMVQKPNADGLRLQGIEHTLTDQNKAMDRMSGLMERVLTTLNGEDDKPGIRGRLDRVETSMGTLSRVLWIIAVAVAGVAVKTFWGLIGGRQ